MVLVWSARDQSLVIEICSLGDKSGSRLAATLARRVLPAPGGPEIRILWCPATATVRARLATSWPRTWSKIGDSTTVLVFFTTGISWWMGFSFLI